MLGSFDHGVGHPSTVARVRRCQPEKVYTDHLRAADEFMLVTGLDRCYSYLFRSIDDMIFIPLQTL